MVACDNNPVNMSEQGRNFEHVAEILQVLEQFEKFQYYQTV